MQYVILYKSEYQVFSHFVFRQHGGQARGRWEVVWVDPASMTGIQTARNVALLLPGEADKTLQRLKDMGEHGVRAKEVSLT